MDKRPDLSHQELVTALAFSEKRFEEALQSARHIMYRLNAQQGGYDYLSPFIEELTGYPLADFKQITLQQLPDYFHPDDRERIFGEQGVLARVAHSRTGDQAFLLVEYRLRKFDGSYCWLRDQSTIHFSADGQIDSIVGAAYDITAQKQAETNLKENEIRYQTLFETMSEGFAFHEVICNEQGEPIDYRYLDINPAFELLTGLQRDTTIGKRVREVLPGIEEHWITTFGRVALSGEPAEVENYVQELDRYYRAKAYSPQRGKFAVVFTEVTEQRKLLQDLQKREAELRVLFESSQAGIILVDQTGRISVANRRMAEMFGCRLEDVIGSHYPNHIHPDQRSTADERMRKLIAGEIDHVAIERHYIRQDGSGFWGYLSGRRHEDAEGRLISLVGHITDITELKYARDALQSLLQQKQVYFDSMPTGCIVWDREFRALEWNPAAEQIFGYPTAEAIGRTAGELIIPPAARPHVDQVWQNLLDGQDFVESSNENITRDGRIIQCEWINTPLRGEDGTTERVISIVQDITERKRSEYELSASREFLSSILENIPNMIFVKDANDLRFESLNRAGEELLGIPREELIGRNDYDLFPKEEADSFTARDREVLTSRQIIDIPEEPIQTASGQRILHTRKIAVLDHNGTPRYLVGISEDITERKLAEEENYEQQQMISAIVESSQDWIWTIDTKGTHTYSNRAVQQILGYPQEEFQGLGLELVHPEDREEIDRLWPEWIASRQGWRNVVLRWRAKDGSYHHLESTAVPIVSSQGELLGFRGVDRDITERMRAENERLHLEQQLLHAQKLESLGVLAGGIAHDFNNILTAVIGNAEMAMMRLNPESPALDNLQRIEKAAARAAELARQMLAYSGKGKFIVEQIDLNRLIEEMGHMLEVSISKKAVLRYNLTKPLPAINVDATQIRQIIMNLVINASEAIGDRSGGIAITTGCLECNEAYLKDAWLTDPVPEGLYVFLEVADSGCGMDKETMDRIFDPFFTTKFTGRGLGMAAVLGIIRGHKGAIKVYSEPGRGSSFKIMLPAGEKPAELFKDEAVTDKWQGSGVVLLVDDEETVRAIGAEMLRELGFDVITANDGHDALEKFKTRNNIRLVILDLTMPHLDGEQCFRELRQLAPDVKVIMSSGFSEHEVTGKFVGKGLSGFIQKPYKLAELKETIKKSGTA